MLGMTNGAHTAIDDNNSSCSLVDSSTLLKRTAPYMKSLNMTVVDSQSFLAGVAIGRYLSHVSPDAILQALHDNQGDVEGVVRMYRVKFWRSFTDVLESLAGWLTLKDLAKIDMACTDKLGRPVYHDWLKGKHKVFGATDDFHWNSKKQIVYLEWLLSRSVLINRMKFKPSLVETFAPLSDVLDLQRNSLTELDFSYLTPSKADLMKVLARGFPKLQTLMAGEVGFVPQPSDIIALAKFCPAVQKFHLKADVTAEAAAQIAASFSSLTHLCLASQSNNGFPFDDAVLRGVADNCPNLEELEYSCTPSERRITDAGMEYFCSRCTKMTVFDLSSSRSLTDSCLLSIAKYCKSLAELSIDNCDSILGSGVKAIAENCPKVVHLTLNCTNMKDEAILAVASHCSNLESIGMDSCEEITDSAFIELLKNCKQLQEVDISGCRSLSRLSYSSIASECVGTLSSLLINEAHELDDSCLYEIVSKCTKLEHLECFDNSVTLDMIDKIRDQFPELEMYTDYDDRDEEDEEDYDDDDDGEEDFDDDDEDFDDMGEYEEEDEEDFSTDGDDDEYGDEDGNFSFVTPPNINQQIANGIVDNFRHMFSVSQEGLGDSASGAAPSPTTASSASDDLPDSITLVVPDGVAAPPDSGNSSNNNNNNSNNNFFGRLMSGPFPK